MSGDERGHEQVGGGDYQTHHADCWRNPRHHTCAVCKVGEAVGLLKEMRDACAAALRVIEGEWPREEELEQQLKLAGIAPGFGKRADDFLKEMER